MGWAEDNIARQQQMRDDAAAAEEVRLKRNAEIDARNRAATAQFNYTNEQKAKAGQQTFENSRATAADTRAGKAFDASMGLFSGLGSGGGGGGGALSGLRGFSGGGGGSFGGGMASNGGGGSSVGPMGSAGGGRLSSLQLPDQSAGTSAAYATAKDQVGQSGRASLDSLRGELGATGMMGGGAEGQLTRDVVTNAAGNLGQVSRDQASKGADLSADFAKTNFAGGITQRGQDVSSQEAQARLAQESRIADASLAFQKQQAASANQLQMLQIALSGLKGGGAGSGLVY